MAPSHLSAMEMRSLLFGVLFGLLAVVHSTPVTTVAQDEVYREVLTDGYIIDSHIPLTTTPSISHAQSSTVLPLNTNDSISILNTQTDEESQDEQGSRAETSTTSPTFLTEEPGSGSGLGDFASEKPEDVSTTTTAVPQDEVYREVLTDGYIIDSHALSPLTTTPSVSHAQSSTVLPLSTDHCTEGSGEETSTASPTFPTEEPGSGYFAAKETSTTSPTFPTEEPGSGSGLGDFAIEKSEDVSTTTTKKTSTASPPSPFEESGLGDFASEKSEDVSTTTTKEPDHANPAENMKNNTENHNLQQIRKVDANPVEKESRLLLTSNVDKPATQSQGHTTPGWIIIVGFIVGLAALIMLCAAIATRDKWNGPKQASQVGTNANSSNQQRELEMETFLHNDKPRENGKAADYTVVPLDDVPENYSSH